MFRQKRLAAIIIATLLISLIVGPVASAAGPHPAAPAVATQLLKAAGVKGFGAYVSQIAQLMGPGASFGGYDKKDVANYRAAVEAFLISIGAFSASSTVLPTGKVPVLIGFTSAPGASDEALVRGAGGTIKHKYNIIPAIAAELPQAAIENLLRNPRITVIEPDIEVQAVGTYADELDNTWGVKRIGAGTAHTAGYVGSSVKVAVIDSGIDYTHTELAGIYAGGYDFVNNDNNPMDDNGHGTHVAGTIAALRNGDGVVGVSPGVALYALKVLGANGSGSYSNIIAAIDWARDNGIHITNNSYGSKGDPGTLVKKAFDNAYNAGVLHVAAAGNEGDSAGTTDSVIYPARYASVMAVSAVNQSDQRASFSSTGLAVELAAPGVSINSTKLGGGYVAYNGTSMASPHVAGVAALVWAKNLGSATNVTVRNALRNTAEDLGLPATHQGYGLVDAANALGLSGSYTLTVSVSPTGSGNVTLNPTQPSAGYPSGTEVTLTAVHATGYVFSRWEGSVTGTANPATIVMDSSKSVTAVFVEPVYHTMTVGVSPTDSGTVTLSPEQPAGGYLSGTEVTLTAAPTTGYVFSRWEGNVTGTANPATVVMDGSKSVTAVFEAAPTTLWVAVTPDKTTYKQNSWANILVTVTGGDASGPAVAGAAVVLTITGGGTTSTYSGTTAANGQVTFRHRIMPKAALGTYEISATATKGSATGTETGSFTVVK